MTTRYNSNVVEGKSPPFPAGTFIGTLTEAKSEWYASDNKQPDKKDSVRINLQFKEITPVEGPQVGSRPLAQRVDVVRAGVSIVDIAEIDDSVPFQLRQAITLVLQLALALGAASSNGDGTVDFDMGPFLESLEAGVHNGHPVMFAVEQRSYASKTAKNADGSARQITASNITAFKGVNGNARTAPAEPTPIQGSTPATESETRTLRTH